MPAGFARFVLEALNPNRTAAFIEDALGPLERILGCRVKAIWAHY
jgi:hypothetical protein